MSLFSKPKVILWPRGKTVEAFIDRKEDNTLSFDINLWEERSVTELQTLAFYVKANKIEEVQILLSDDVVLTKSFIYDTKITQIEKKEVIGLAESFVHFKIEPDSIEYSLVQETDKTIIQSVIFDAKKISQLQANLSKLNLKITGFKSVSTAIAATIHSYYQQPFFLLYPLSDNEFTLLLAKNGSVYLTATVKGPNFDIQKIINYSNLYFSSPVNKLFIPHNTEIEVSCSTQLEKTQYNESQIASEHHKPLNLPLPVLGFLSASNKINPAIINTPNDTSLNKQMSNKRNILPIAAVFIFTAALASIIIWFVLNRNTAANLDNPNSDQVSDAVPTIEIEPTEIPQPTVAEIKKSIKIQVLNATDINGQAALLKEKLTNLGFTSIALGNSKEKATENVIKVKESLTGGTAYFQGKLNSSFPATYEDLDSTSAYDVVLIIGTDIRDSSASSSDEELTATPTKKLTSTPTPTKKLSPTPTEEE